MAWIWAVLLRLRLRDPIGMSRQPRQHVPSSSEQLGQLLGKPWPFPGRPSKHDLSTWTVTDAWPEHIPVSQAEIALFKRGIGDVFEELFGAKR